MTIAILRTVCCLLGVIFNTTHVAAMTVSEPAEVDSPKCVVAIPFEMVGNLVFFEVRVNGSRPLSFILDSGASACIIDAARARELQIAFGKLVQGKGAGEGSYDVWLIDKDRVGFALPGLLLHADVVAAFDLSSNLSVLGRPVDGIIGYDLIDQYVTEIDYDAQVLRLFNPRTYTYQGKGTPLPLVLSDRVPHVVVNIEVPGRPAESRTLLVDSGSNDAVDDSTVAHSSSVRRVLSGVGNGKEFQGIEGHISCFKLGNYTIKEFTGGGSGVPLIGGEVLRRFTVVFDYYHKRMFLEPNRHITEPVAEDRSGIAIRWDADKSVFLVHDISVGSPATRSGLKKGDMITAIDGCPSAAFRLDRVVRLLGEDHKSVTFTIRRQERDVSVTLTTGSLMPTSAKSH